MGGAQQRPHIAIPAPCTLQGTQSCQWGLSVALVLPLGGSILFLNQVSSKKPWVGGRVLSCLLSFFPAKGKVVFKTLVPHFLVLGSWSLQQFDSQKCRSARSSTAMATVSCWAPASLLPSCACLLSPNSAEATQLGSDAHILDTVLVMVCPGPELLSGASCSAPSPVRPCIPSLLPLLFPAA